MNKELALNKLKVSLAENIQNWMNGLCEKKEWEVLNILIGEKTSYLMAESAIKIIEGLDDCQECLRKEGYLED